MQVLHEVEIEQIQIDIKQEPLIISLPKIQIHRDALLLEFRLKGS